MKPQFDLKAGDFPPKDYEVANSSASSDSNNITPVGIVKNTSRPTFKFPTIFVILVIIALITAGGFSYLFYVANGKVLNGNISPRNTDTKSNENLTTINSQSFLTSTITNTPTLTPKPTNSPTPSNLINFESKGETDLEKSVTAKLISAWKENDRIKINVELKNNSGEEQKALYFLFELTSQNVYDEENHRFQTSKGQPYDKTIAIPAGTTKTVTVSFDKVSYPYILYYWTSNRRVNLGYTKI